MANFTPVKITPKILDLRDNAVSGAMVVRHVSNGLSDDMIAELRLHDENGKDVPVDRVYSDDRQLIEIWIARNFNLYRINSYTEIWHNDAKQPKSEDLDYIG